MRRVSIGLLMFVLFDLAHAADDSLLAPKCDAGLSAEVERLENGLLLARQAWQQEVDAKFRVKATALTPRQVESARQTFTQLVAKMSDVHAKAVSLPGIYRTLLLIPQYDPKICSELSQMRALGDQVISGYKQLLADLLPLVDVAAETAARDG